jgi:dTDP-4-amino-4,6-dideoxygalactose transaminase
MIQLFNIPNYTIDTSEFNNLLHDKVVKEFEQRFCEYVGAKYGCSINSATNAIFLSLKLEQASIISIPSIIPPVVINAAHHAGCFVKLTDNVEWVGYSYILYEDQNERIIDSAQRVDRNQYIQDANDDDLMIFSFYPTKPVGSCDGGMVVSNNGDMINWIRKATINGTSCSENSWNRSPLFPGWKMYMNSIQAWIALRNLEKLDAKKIRLKEIRDAYNDALGYKNISDHLYRIQTKNNEKFIEEMKNRGITCGRHYEATHRMPVYNPDNRFYCPQADFTSQTTVSIPFHEALTDEDVQTVIKNVRDLHEPCRFLEKWTACLR